MTEKQDSRPEGSETNEEKPKIKVVDRRMFDAEGNPRRPDVDESEEPRSEATDSDPTSTGPTPSPLEPTAEPSEVSDEPEGSIGPEPTIVDPADASGPEPTPPDPADAAGPEPAPADPAQAAAAEEPAAGASFADLPRDFSAFVESQYVEAMIFLGAVPHPQTGETLEDPAFAGYKIDLLAMLQEKTQGNLTDDEARLIQDVLYQLRMLYVQKTQGAQP